MPRAAVDDNNRVALRVRAAEKAVIMRTTALEQTDMTTFILRTAHAGGPIGHRRTRTRQADSTR